MLANLTLAQVALLCPAFISLLKSAPPHTAPSRGAATSTPATSASIVAYDLEELWKSPGCNESLLAHLAAYHRHQLRKYHRQKQSVEEADSLSVTSPLPPHAFRLGIPLPMEISEDAPESATEADYSGPTRVVMTVIFASLTLVGVVGNLLVVLVVKRVPGMITPTNCYLVSLAVSDCMFFLASTPTELQYLHVSMTEYLFGDVGCAVLSYLPYLAINTSSLSITAFTVERFIGICYPLRARYICTVKRAKLIILALWAFGILYNSPWLYLANVVDDEINGRLCTFKLSRDSFAYKIMYMGDFAAFYLIPMILYIYIYGKITYTLSRSGLKHTADALTLSTAGGANGHATANGQKKSTSSAGTATNAREYFVTTGGGGDAGRSGDGGGGRRSSTSGSKVQVIKMLAVVVFVFAVCWLPYRAMVMYNSFSDEAVRLNPEWYIFFSKTLIYINCAINPILYNLMSARFRNAFRRFLKGRGSHLKSFASTQHHNTKANSLHTPTSLPPPHKLIFHPPYRGVAGGRPKLSLGDASAQAVTPARVRTLCTKTNDGEVRGENEPLMSP